MANNILTAQQMINRARSLADLPNAQFITYQDQLDSLNESYGDVYEKLIESNDDFYVNEYIITPLASQIVPNSMNDEYLIPLPSDFYKLRQLSYFDGSYWHTVVKHTNTDMPRNRAQPCYRLRGQNLHLLGMATYSVSSLKMEYYPPKMLITQPDQVLTFGSGLTQNQIWSITNAIDYTPVQNTTIYYIPSTQILYADSLTLNNSAQLLTAQASAISNIDYYKGSIYFLQNGNIYSASTDLMTTPIVPTAIISTANVANFTINNVSGVDSIYYWNGTNTIQCSLKGTGSTIISAVFSNDYCFVQGVVSFLTNTGAVNVNGSVLPTALASYTMLSSDGTNLYVLDSSYNLHQLQLLNTAGVWTVSLDTIMYSNVYTMGPLASSGYGQATNRWGIITLDPYVQAISATINTTFSYPFNAVNEIIAYQTAVDMSRKQDNVEKVQLLMQRLATLWERYQSQFLRDDFQYERISNYYSPTNRWI